ncbi:MAG: 16S rRNA (adenine(1518)-N(6)/adenine(1519)-N(6))-dimethyltransferase RsmA [Thaumarchaeota archaeon]|nr:16S rRNA (adenine(1518)-N(6)/adenine(1519)-N(6))-dimethyltransferase RsmA [Nitrososphaerota archaeon]
MRKFSGSSRSSRRIRLGQHMLVAERTADQIVDSSELLPEDVVLEIGTGTGTLTKRLAQRVKRVISYEVDPRLFEEACLDLLKFRNVELVYGDAFKKENDSAFNVCVTNLPYSQSLTFVKWLSRRPSRFRLAVATLQSEFAQKLLSAPGENSYKAVSVMAQLSFDLNRLFSIGPEAFHPKPKVNSEIVKFYPKTDIPWPFMDQRKITLLNFLFSFRGRFLNSAVKKLAERTSPITLSNAILSKRVEELSPAEFVLILHKIEGSRT